MGKFKSMNFMMVNCEGCGEKTTIEPGTEFSALNCNCKAEKPKLNDTEISKPVQQELDYVKTQTVTVIGRFKDGDYEVCNGNNLDDTWRVPKDTFESTYEIYAPKPKGTTDETPETATDDKKDCVSKGSDPLVITLEDIKSKTPNEIADTYDINVLRSLAKSVGMRNVGQTGEAKLIGKLLAKVA